MLKTVIASPEIDLCAHVAEVDLAGTLGEDPSQI
jgi:hypothetical protein